MKRKYIIWGILAILVILQFFQIDKTNPPASAEADFLVIEQVPDQLATLFKAACYDCHSHHSKYPWYTSVAPLSWWIEGHIDHGRETLNFSEWSTLSNKDRNHALEEIAEEVRDKHMPLKSYVWMHSEAKMSDTDIKLMADWAVSKQSQ